MIGIIGAGGHAKVITDIFRSQKPNERIVFFTMLPEAVDPYFLACEIEKDSEHVQMSYRSVLTGWHVAIGNPHIRRSKVEWLLRTGCPVITAVHVSSVLAVSSKLGVGSSVMAGSIVNPDAVVGRGCIINTAAGLDHDCQIGDYVNIGPGCRLAGNVSVGKLSELGAGAVVIPGIRIGKGCVIGAGTVVTRNLPDYSKAVGVPARVIGELPPSAD
ncbi:acetyltransferase [Paenibacillus sp. Soil522]|uniref:acetyltransferase n=1 Tax=Paenibacillus sp. Soil522 TaxID=1736388 RepID=UPI0006FCFCD1|nr:acetyltransferase [Paenibacillus sp. Soil522]KRE46293.1 transferase [Paenibacillus sp. Soil522]